MKGFLLITLVATIKFSKREKFGKLEVLEILNSRIAIKVRNFVDAEIF